MNEIKIYETDKEATIDEILAHSQNGVIEALKIINNQNKKRDAEMAIMKEDIESQKKDLSEVKKNTNVVCSPFHTKRKRYLRNICRSHVWKLFNDDPNSSQYILFSHYFFKRIYHDLAAYFDLDSWYDIDMTDYTSPDSMYAQAKEYATYWKPSDWYIRNCVDSLIIKRDNGLLSPERCRALTNYLRITNNGDINPFS